MALPPLRIHLLTHYFAPEVGAAPNRLTRLARDLQARGHTVQVIAPVPTYPDGRIAAGYGGRLLIHERLGGVQVGRLAVLPWPGHSTKARILHQMSFMVGGGLRALALPRPDVYLVESHPLFVGLASWAIGVLKRAPVVLNVSDLWPESAVALGALQSSRLIQLATWMEHRAYGGAAEIVAMTRGIEAGVRRVVSPARHDHVHLITNSVPTDRFHPGVDGLAVRARFNLPPGRFVVGYLGNLGLAQKLETLLDAAHLLRDNPDITFLIVGGGAREEALHDYAAALALPNVIFAGGLPFDQMPQALAAVDASAILLRDAPIFEGALPSKLFEAMAAGKPVAATLRGEAVTLLEEAGAGLAAAPEDAAGLAAILRQMQADPAARAAMGARGRAYAGVNLAPEAILDRWEGVLYQAVHGRARAKR